MTRPAVATVLLTLLLTACVATPAGALSPDEIVLIVNQNVPESRALAEFYVTARQIPQGRILELDLPNAEAISLVQYERDVVPRVRDFLQNAKFAEQVTCLVTFYGVPLRINPRVLSPEENRELAQLKADEEGAIEELKKSVALLEAEVKSTSPAFRPARGEQLDQLAARAEAALRILWQRALETPDKQLQSQRVQQLARMVQTIGGAAGVLQAFGARATSDEKGQAALKQMAEQVAAAAAEVKKLEDRRYEPESRERLRELVRAHFGIIHHAKLLQLQQDYLAADKSNAALDSELALLWWPYYKRSAWHINPLNHQVEARGRVFPTLMVMRLDAPQSGMVREMILASLRAERDGLNGKVVLDSRGIEAKGEAGKFGGYGWYDQSIRDLAGIIRTKTKLPLLHDDSPGLLPPKSADNVAIYCGWYSLRNYVPSVRLTPGAVGFHVASFELVSLRNPEEKGWVPNLIRNGIAATLGSIDEPYLAAFPPADEFFPLLLTGRLSLAEVYWKTTPYTSWMVSMIGDPLYRPFQKNPAILPADLPAPLRNALQKSAAATQPATTQPATVPTRAR